MLKSNNQCHQPDFFGEKKGEFSPFFHILNSEEFQSISFKKGIDASFLARLSTDEIDTIFHKKERETLEKAARSVHRKGEAEMQTLLVGADKMTSALESIRPLLCRHAPRSLRDDSASLTLEIRNVLFDIRNIFLEFNIGKREKEEYGNIFFHIQKMLLLWEILAEYDPNTAPPNALPPLPSPERLNTARARLTELVLTADRILEVETANCVRAAAKESEHAYLAALEHFALALHDIISLLKNYRNEV